MAMRSPSYQMITTQPKWAQLWHFECPHQRLRHIFIPAHSEGKVLANLYIQMGKGQGKIGRWPPLLTLVLAL